MMESNATVSLNILFNGTTPEYEFRLPFEWHEIIAPAILLWIFFILGMLLNSLTIAVIVYSSELSNPFMFVLVSLCTSDLLSAFSSPFAWYRRTFGYVFWEISSAMCKIYMGTYFMTSFATGANILFYAIMRYVYISSTRGHKINIKITKIIVVFIWVISIGAGFVPMAIFVGARKRPRLPGDLDVSWPSCTLVPAWANHAVTYLRIAEPIFLGFPVIMVTILSILMARHIHRHSNSNIGLPSENQNQYRRKKKHAFMQLLLIVIAFIFAYFPMFIYHMWTTASSSNTPHQIRVDYWVATGQYLVVRFSECMNPILYNLGSPKMRRQTRKFLRDKTGWKIFEKTKEHQTHSTSQEKTLSEKRRSVLFQNVIKILI